MRRVLAFLHWRSDWWSERVAMRTKNIDDKVLLDGLQAYARRQATLQANLATSFQAMWAIPLYEGIQDILTGLQDEEENDDEEVDGSEKEVNSGSEQSEDDDG